MAQQDLVAEKLPKHSACRHGVWSLVHFVIFGWSLGFQQENQAANHQSMDLPSIDGDVTDIRGYSPSMRETNTCIYIYIHALIYLSESRSKCLKTTLVLQEFFVRDVHETL